MANRMIERRGETQKPSEAAHDIANRTGSTEAVHVCGAASCIAALAVNLLCSKSRAQSSQRKRRGASMRIEGRVEEPS